MNLIEYEKENNKFLKKILKNQKIIKDTNDKKVNFKLIYKYIILIPHSASKLSLKI